MPGDKSGHSKTATQGRKTVKPPVATVRLMLVDDHPLWRQTMREVFEETDQVDIVAEASDGQEAVDYARKARPDVALMDVHMTGMDGVSATEALSEASPKTRVLVLSASDARADVIGALAAGASGYLLKTAGANEIRDGVTRVAGGEVVLPATLASYVVDSLRAVPGRPRDPIDELTERESDILALMAKGHSNPSICDQVHLSAKTVEGYISSIFTKLELEPTRDQHRRVLAVLRFVEAQGRGARS